jgi:formylglycine-generating enzyme required for sulfatase activity
MQKIVILLLTVLINLILDNGGSTRNLNPGGKLKDKSSVVEEHHKDLILIKGGTFDMGDVFNEGADDEQPVHQVTLSDFYLSRYEVTVAQFRSFVEETGYVTSAEGPHDSDAKKKIMAQYMSGEFSEQEKLQLHEQFLRYGGAGFWDAEKRKWAGYNPQINWKNPGIEQTDADPVQAISPDDAMNYCNWLSKKAGLPVAYDLETGDILDAQGNPTLDITSVKGFRLPTETEWEYAAREGGRKVRFGNGKNVGRSSEINFRGDDGKYGYLELGEYAGGTKPVGSYPPNRLGLYDMSGNAWEWVSDKYAKYNKEPQVNPYITTGGKHALRGGRWGGDAYEIRVFHRDPYPRNDRCNNSGFRIAKSGL